jgi:putative nucleotidyltransferase with HDIG domain
MTAIAESGEIAIRPSQVRVGVHVRIPLPWTQHSFMTSSFVVSSDAQVREILALGIDLYCDPSKGRVQPMPVVQAPAPDPAREQELARLRDEQKARIALKHERQAAMKAMRTRLDATQQSFVHAADQAAVALRQFGARPKESVRTMLDVSAESTRSLLSDPDSTILLVTDKGVHLGDTSHAISVMTLALLLAKRLGEPEDVLHTIGAGALLHDVGMGRLDHSLVRNPARNRFEEVTFQSHCALGHAELRAIGQIVPPRVLDVVLRHHEREDGKGYPAGLAGDAIPKSARIVALADRFDELTNPPDAARAMSPFEALASMWTRERAGFNEVLLQHFIRAMGIYPPGTLVQLSDGRIGVVIAAAPETARLCPQVLVYDAATPRREAIIVDLASASASAGQPAPLKIDKALRMQERSDAELDYLLPRRKVSWFRATA